jgi:DNA-binding NarL/FixJ family response regulator
MLMTSTSRVDAERSADSPATLPTASQEEPLGASPAPERGRSAIAFLLRLHVLVQRILARIVGDPRFLDSVPHDRQETLARLDGGAFQVVVVVVPAPRVPLTSRQREIASLVGRGLGNRGIARRLDLSPGTVANHLKEINRRLGTHTRAALARYAALMLD